MPNLDEAGPSAQERLQMQSLRNVRALVDKLEREEAAKPSVGVGLMIAAGILVVGVLGIVLVATVKRGDASRRPAAVDTQLLSVDDYLAQVVARINTRANAPNMAKVREYGASAQGLVGITLRERGDVEARIVKSSGDSRVDSALLSLVQFAGPYGPPPKGVIATTQTLAMTIEAGKVVARRVP